MTFVLFHLDPEAALSQHLGGRGWVIMWGASSCVFMLMSGSRGMRAGGETCSGAGVRGVGCPLFTSGREDCFCRDHTISEGAPLSQGPISVHGAPRVLLTASASPLSFTLAWAGLR